MDIGDAALQAFAASLKEQAGRVHAPVQEHANLGTSLLQSVESGNENDMQWGIHDRHLGKDIAYSVSHHYQCCLLDRCAVCWYECCHLSACLP